jgi:uncharacterized membrane protein
MNKARLEAFSDGVFSIVVTLLIFDIKVPTLGASVSDAQLWYQIGLLSPLIIIYAVTFAVLSVLWINHHFLFHLFAHSVDRKLNLLNLCYLMFVAFIPFSAYLIGLYPTHQPAAVIYGLNIFATVALSTAMTRYIRRHPELMNENVSARLIKQARFRGGISLISYMIGIVVSFFYAPASVLFYAFPVIFNIIPGTLDFLERHSPLDFG